MVMHLVHRWLDGMSYLNLAGFAHCVCLERWNHNHMDPAFAYSSRLIIEFVHIRWHIELARINQRICVESQRNRTVTCFSPLSSCPNPIPSSKSCCGRHPTLRCHFATWILTAVVCRWLCVCPRQSVGGWWERPVTVHMALLRHHRSCFFAYENGRRWSCYASYRAFVSTNNQR